MISVFAQCITSSNQWNWWQCLAKMVIQWFPGKPAAVVPTEVAEIGEASAEVGMVMLPIWKGDTEWKEATPWIILIFVFTFLIVMT